VACEPRPGKLADSAVLSDRPEGGAMDDFMAFEASKRVSESDINVTNSLAGVGIFFQQDSDTNEVFVKTIVTGGSADRSGVIRVSDVVVRVDHDNVEGQPLSTLRSRILGRQGSYVTLGFRRKDGMETTYYDVPLMRGSPEYFDSLKANQPLQDELERFKRQNHQLEQQRQADAQELHRFRTHMEAQRTEFDRKFLSMDDALARKDEEISRLQLENKRLSDHKREAEMTKGDLNKIKESYMDDNRRHEEKEQQRNRYVEELKQKMDDERSRLESQMRKLEVDLRNERRMREESEAREHRLGDESKRREDEVRAKAIKNQEGRQKFETEKKRLQEMQKINENIGGLLREMDPRLGSIEADLFVRDKLSAAAGPSLTTSLSSSSANARRADDGSFFMA